jgi:hypothetical protein
VPVAWGRVPGSVAWGPGPPGRCGVEDAAGIQKFFGRPSLRRAMMFFWISDAPPPMVSMTV